MRGRLLLPNTCAAILALLLLPGAALLLWPRPQAQGLARVLPQVQLLQSFAAAPSRPLPALWRQRLGAAAAPLWARQQGVWWQFWGAHDDAGAYLALPAASLAGLPSRSLPQPPLIIDDLAVVAADPLSRQALAERLRGVTRLQRGLEQRCLQQLQQPQGVFWNPAGLGSLTGPVAPLLQTLQQGCMRLELRGLSLSLSGEAAASSGVLAALPQERLNLPTRPLPTGVLLELRGPSFAVLLQGLLARQLVRDPLAERYGISQAKLRLLKRLPFVLRLRQQSQGAFQAGLELELAPPLRDRKAWMALLAGLQEPLRQQGLRPIAPTTPAAPAQALPAISWGDDSERPLGGWRWIGAAGGATGTAPRLLLFLGPEPRQQLTTPPPSPQPTLLLRARPAELDQLGLWPQAFPGLVRTASSLDLAASGGGPAPISLLRGRLELRRPR